MIKTFLFPKNLTGFLAAVAIFFAATVADTRPAFAQCEDPASPGIASAAAIAAQSAAVTAMTAAIIAAVESATVAARSAVIAGMNAGWQLMKAQLNLMWSEWEQALKDMTKQMHSGLVDQTRQISNIYDSENLSETGRRIQKAEYQAKKQYVPTDQGCRFDTTAQYQNQAVGLKKALSAGYAEEFSKIGSNDSASPAARGKGPLMQSRWNTYVTKFCDPNSNGGMAPCAGANPNANRHIMPSKTLFAKETIDMSDVDTADAVRELIYNITGYTAPDPMRPTAFASGPGIEKRRRNREHLTQMDAVGALVWAVVSERSRGRPAPDIQAMRQKFGVADASPNPSLREIRQAVVEQLWDPNYYVDLADSSSTTAQKEIYLKAYSLTLLYSLIEKTSMLSNAYAIETANMLSQTPGVMGNAADMAPIR